MIEHDQPCIRTGQFVYSDQPSESSLTMTSSTFSDVCCNSAIGDVPSVLYGEVDDLLMRRVTLRVSPSRADTSKKHAIAHAI